MGVMRLGGSRSWLVPDGQQNRTVAEVRHAFQKLVVPWG